MHVPLTELTTPAYSLHKLLDDQIDQVGEWFVRYYKKDNTGTANVSDAEILQLTCQVIIGVPNIHCGTWVAGDGGETQVFNSVS